MVCRSRLLIVALLSLTLGACATATAPPAPDTSAADLAAINAVRTQFAAAFNGADASAIGNLYTNDAVSMPPNRPNVSGRDAIVADNKTFFEQFTSPRIEITATQTDVSGDWGIDVGTFQMTMTPKAGGSAVKDTGKYIVILQKQGDGSWKVVRDITNSDLPPMPMPAPAPAGKD